MTAIKIILVFAILSGALTVTRAYRSFCEKRIASGEALLDFLKFRGSRISLFMSPKSEICRNYSNPILEECGFLPELSRGKSFSDAFASARSALSLSDAANEKMERIFSEMGKGYLADEREKQGELERELKELFSAEREELKRSVKVKTTLILSAALGAVILLL